MVDDAREVAARRFSGRDAELEVFERVLSRDDSAVVWVFGPGGIGKSALTAAFLRRAEQSGARTAFVDLRTVEPDIVALRALIDRAADGPADRRLVLAIDAFERATGCVDWMYEHLLGSVPSGTILILAGREGPDRLWREHSNWSVLTEIVALRALSGPESSLLLERSGVEPDLVAAAAEIARGHPLALVLLAEVSRTAPCVPTELSDVPDLIAQLVGQIVEDLPSEEHRTTLDVAALARVTTRGLLRATGNPSEADRLFDWLRSQPYVSDVSEGLCLHDLTRDVLEADLRRADPDRYALLHHRIRDHVLSRAGRPGAADGLVRDLIYLHRGSSMMSSYWDWATFGNVEVTGLRPPDEAVIVELLRRNGVAAEVPIAHYWMARQPEAFRVVRSPTGEMVGVSAELLLDQPSEQDLLHDPCVAAVWDHAQRNDPLRPGQRIGIHRFFEDRECGQTASATFNVVSAACAKTWLTTPGLAWYYVAAIRDEEYWGPMMSYLDFQRIRSADHVIGTTAHPVFAHDWRRRGPAHWLDLMEERELGAEVAAPAPPPSVVALDAGDFQVAVRAALRDLARPDRLAHNPLIRSRVVADSRASPDAAALMSVMIAARDALVDDPRTYKARRALDRTFFHGAISQEAAAAVLDMAFSTYRRHLSTGIAMLTEQLWGWELYGYGAP